MNLLEFLITFILGGITCAALLAWRVWWTTKRDVDDSIGGRGKNYEDNC